MVFGLCGFTLYLAWMFMAYISPTLFIESIETTNWLATAGLSPDLFIRLIQLIVLLLTLLIAWRTSDRFSSIKGVLAMLTSSVILTTIGFFLIVFSGTLDGATNSTILLIFLASSSASYGIAQAFMLLLWGTFLSVIGEPRILLFTSLCVGCAAGLVLLMSFLQPAPAAWITLSLSWLSMGCFAYIRFKLPGPPKPLLIKAKTSDKRLGLHAKSTISIIIYSAAIGFSVCFLLANDSGLFGIISASIAVILSAFVTGLDSARFHFFTRGHLAKLQTPALLVGVSPFFFDSVEFKIVGCSFLLFFFMIVYIINLTALSEHVRIYRLNSIRVFGFSRAGNAFGFLAGGFICYLAFFAPYTFLFGPIETHVWAAIILLGFLGIFVLGSSFAFEDLYPVSKSSGKSTVQIAKANVQKSKNLPKGDLHTLSTYMLDRSDDEEPQRAGAWSKRVTTLSKEYSLSPKETEVLFLLAKGRNAEYIQNELVVSRHTAKAHIYHIYQKTGVHSRQALIDLLESVDISHE